MIATTALSAQGGDGSGLVDGCGRRIDYLRVSVNAHCDLRCLYCQPSAQHESAQRKVPFDDTHRLELIRFLHHRYGLSQVRITGGEPLLHHGVVDFVASLRESMPHLSLAMTTHGGRLYRKSFELWQAGLDRINVSLDSLKPDRYARITGGCLDDVLAGLDSAIFVGFAPLKINTVVLRGVNDDEVVELARWALLRGLQIRFLEAMPIGSAARTNRKAFIPAREIRHRLAEHFTLQPLVREPGEVAQRYTAACGPYRGVIGFITPVSEPFCTHCSRMRITAEGRLFPCLLDDRSVDLTAAWQGGRFCEAKADELIHIAVHGKQPQGRVQPTNMVTLGG